MEKKMELNKCVEYMKEKHRGQKRIQGTPYYMHPLAVSNMLKNKGLSEKYQITGLFHDLLEDTNTTYEDILKLTDNEIAEAVDLLTKHKGYKIQDYIGNIKNNDISRMVKLADRIHNLSEVHFAPRKMQERYIKETEDWFIDLAQGTIFERDLHNVLYKVRNYVEKSEELENSL